MITKTELNKPSEKTDMIDILFFCMIVLNNTLGKDPSLYVISKGFVAAFSISVLVVMIVRKYLILNINIALIGLFFIMETVSILWSADASYSVFRWETQVQLFFLFIAIFDYIALRGQTGLFISAVYVSGYTLLFYTVFRYGTTGILTALKNFERIGGVINNENEYGMVYAVAAVVAFYWVTQKRSKLHILSIFLFSAFALASGSKQSIIMITFGIIGVCVAVYGLRRIYKALLIVLIMSLVLLYALNSGLFGNIFGRFSSLLSGNLNISDYRRLMYKITGIELISNSPVIGYGLASFAKISGYEVYSHDNLIEICVGTGIVGGVLYYIPWISSAISLFLNRKDEKNDSALVFVLVALNIVLGIVSVQYVQRFSWTLLAVSLGLLFNKNKRKLSEHQ